MKHYASSAPAVFFKVPPCSWDWFIVRYFVAYHPLPFEYMPIFVGFIDPLLDSGYSTQCMGCNRNPIGSQNLGTGSGPYEGHEEKSAAQLSKYKKISCNTCNKCRLALCAPAANEGSSSDFKGQFTYPGRNIPKGAGKGAGKMSCLLSILYSGTPPSRGLLF